MHPLDAPAAIATGLVLGLTSGGHCFWTCASVMGPYLVSTAPSPTRVRWSTVPSALRTLQPLPRLPRLQYFPYFP